MHKYSTYANYKKHTNTTYLFMDTCIHVCIRIKSWSGSLYFELVIVVTSDRMGREIRLGDGCFAGWGRARVTGRGEANTTECLQLLILDEGILSIGSCFVFSVFNFPLKLSKKERKEHCTDEMWGE